MPRFAKMTAEECWRRLGAEGVGRIGFNRGRGPRIHPVNYTVVDQVLYVRTAADSEFDGFVTMFSAGAFVAFEVDQLDSGGRDRWSVLVTARVCRSDQETRQRLLPGKVPVPAPAGPRPVLVRVDPVEITGRQLIDSETDTEEVTPAVVGRSRRLPSNWLG